MSCSTCNGHAVRYVAAGCAHEPVACDATDPRREPCQDCGHGDPAAQLECNCCGGSLPGSPAVLHGDLLCDACLLAITDPSTVTALLTIGLSTTGRWA